MIALTRLDGTPVLINIDLLQQVERTPDTLLTLSNGEMLMVRESPDVIVDRVIEFKRAVTDAAGRLAVAARTRTVFGEAQP